MTSTNESIGWKSRVEVALGTVHRMVLQGNILDSVLQDDPPLKPVPLANWLVSRLRKAGYQRIVCYDHGSDPEIAYWQGMEPQEGLRALMQPEGAPRVEMRRTDPSNPLAVLGRFHDMLADASVPGVCILKFQEHRYRVPSEEAVALQRLTSGAVSAPVSGDEAQDEGDEQSGEIPNLAIMLYADENQIPQEFLRTDPDTALVRVPYPGFTERVSYFYHNQSAFYVDAERASTYAPEELARLTEGYRLHELEQLGRLSEQEQIGIDGLHNLQDLLRFGRRENPWSQMDDMATADRKFSQVRGQDEAIAQVKNALLRGKWGIPNLIDPSSRKPPMVLFFVGGTGVGKTMMARQMADFLTGSPDGLKIIDMSEYRQEHSVQRLIGAPPSYVGFSEGGQLTNRVKERPFSVVLFDEVEKANERILDIFLQILDGARLTDGKGETVDFSQTGLIFTSNIGTEDIPDSGLNRDDYAVVTEYFNARVKEYFEDMERPEIYNRLKSGIVVFNFISQADARTVIEYKVTTVTRELNRKLQSGEIVFTTDDDSDLIDSLLGCVDLTYGMRDVDNILMTKIGNTAARFLDSAAASDYHLQGQYRYCWIADEERVKITQ